jgi:hypothetical protein
VHVCELPYFVDLTGREHVGDFLHMQRRCLHAARDAWSVAPAFTRSPICPGIACKC